MNRFRDIRVLGIIALALVVVGLFFSFPVWKQNHFNALMSEQVALRKLHHDLSNQVMEAKLKLARHQNRDWIETQAKEKFGLGYQQMPELLAVVQEDSK